MAAPGQGDAYSVELEMFEGPLDLLLHLVKKHELDILDIPVGFVTEKYLAYLDAWHNVDVDVAAEYLVMAATLCHIKSRELLPREATVEAEADSDEDLDVDDAVDPRAELIRRLLEYQKYREVADNLGNRPVVGRNVWMRGADTEDVVAENVSPDIVAPLLPFPVSKLIEAFDRLMQRAKLKVSHNVIVDRLSVSQKIAELTELMEREERVSFFSLFSFIREGREVTREELRHEAVVTFLAILELGKLRLIRVSQAMVVEPPLGADADAGLDTEAGADATGADYVAPRDRLVGDIVIERAIDDLRSRVSQSVVGADDYR